MATGVLKGTDMIKKKFIEKRIQELTDGYMVTDAVFMRDYSADTNTVIYEENPNGLTDFHNENEVEERVEGGGYPRIGDTAEQKQAVVKDYGLEALVTYDAIRFNRINSINRAYIKLGNSLIKFVDNKGLKALTDNYNAASAKINTLAAGVGWAGSTADPFADLMKAKSKVDSAGYIANLALIHPEDWTNALINKNFREALDEDVPADRKIVHAGIMYGQVAGLTVVAARNITKGNVWVGQDQVVGNRHETSNGVEISVYDDRPGFEKSSKVVSSYREIEHVLTDPKAGCLVTAV
jgi:hypothetical protein